MPTVLHAALRRSAPPRPPHDLLPYLDGVAAGLLLVRSTGRDIVANEPARLFLGLEPSDAQASTVPRLLRRLRSMAGPDWPGLKRALRAAFAPHRPQNFEISLGDRLVDAAIHPVPGEGWTVTFADVTARRTAEAQAMELARLDPLTGLGNRLHMRERIDQSLATAGRPGENCAVLLVDLDRFKPVNDTLGHPVGDALLCAVAGRLRTIVRSTDTIARMGGDEFVVLQTNVAGADEAETLARRVVDLLGRSYIVEGHLVTIGASVGVALGPADGADTDTLLKNADLALYRAKLDGRGTFRFFEPAMDARMRERRRLELDLRQALARREFLLHYQPQMNLETDRLVGCEALIRWKHPERGMVSPLDFIPLAEEVGLIGAIGEWVVRQACRDAATWPADVTVAVNLSPSQFKNPRLVETVVSALASSGLDPRRLELEITETVLLQESEDTLAMLHRLREFGIRISLDDFGTGYSSLSYLRSFPFDKLKIDRSFINDLETKPGADAIIQAIAGLGRSLGMTTVAEGVETSDQMRRIRTEGCTDVQGYFISKPMPGSDVNEFLRVQTAALPETR